MKHNQLLLRALGCWMPSSMPEFYWFTGVRKAKPIKEHLCQYKSPSIMDTAVSVSDKEIEQQIPLVSLGARVRYTVHGFRWKVGWVWAHFCTEGDSTKLENGETSALQMAIECIQWREVQIQSRRKRTRERMTAFQVWNGTWPVRRRGENQIVLAPSFTNMKYLTGILINANFNDRVMQQKLLFLHLISSPSSSTWGGRGEDKKEVEAEEGFL